MRDQPDMGVWDVAGVAARRVGGRVLNGVVERHLGFDGVDVAGALGMAGDIVVPAVKDAYTAQPDEHWTFYWARRLKWTAGIVGGVAVTAGIAYAGWRWLGKPKDEATDEEAEDA